MSSELKEIDKSIELKRYVSWDNSIENNIISIGQKSKGYKIMHIQESRRLSICYDILMYLGILSGPLSGLLSGIGSSLNPDAPTTFPIISACIAFISGIFVAVIKFGKFEEKSTSHKLAASKYTSLESNVSRQMTLSREHRLNAIQYLEYVGKSFDELFSSSPLVSRHIYENYIKLASINGLCIPDEYNIKIDINNSHIVNITNNTQQTQQTNNTQDISKNITKNMETKDIQKKHNLYSNNNICELNTYSDGRMGYEMNRLLELSK